ncbi:MAG: hypothetical protein ACR2NW_09420 [Thermodesulfobacteriota bacterium]
MKPLTKEDWEKIKEKEFLLKEAGKLLKVSSNHIIDRLNKLIAENNELKREIAELSGKDNKD